MTPEERLDRIETALLGVIESQRLNQQSLASLTESIARYADAADARMRRIEDNLDGLIRAIAAEHTNGKSVN